MMRSSNASVERVFSKFTYTYSKLRQRMSVEKLEMLLFLNWNLAQFGEDI